MKSKEILGVAVSSVVMYYVIAAVLALGVLGLALFFGSAISFSDSETSSVLQLANELISLR